MSLPTPYYRDADGQITLYCGDCREILPQLEPGSVDLVLTDPPFMNVKSEWWDRQWRTVADYLDWYRLILREFTRTLAPNGSLYVFASPEMSARVEITTGEFFTVLNRITWAKPPFATKAEMFDKETMRAYFPSSESIIFAEQCGSDRAADDASGYTDQCESAKRGVFGEYLASEFERAGVSRKEIAALFPSVTGGLTGCVSNWLIGYNQPTAAQYQAMRDFLNSRNGNDEFLRRDYEELRRPFFAAPTRPYTDVWTFRTVGAHNGKHPCQKPQVMTEHMIQTSSRLDATVLDPFAGSGTTLIAARQLGRRAIGIEIEEWYCEIAVKRLAQGCLNLV